jgi:para-aminobenzoate synthetase component 1
LYLSGNYAEGNWLALVVSEHRPIPNNLSALRAAVAQQADCALLESAPGFDDLGRWSILAAYPRAIFQVRDARWSLSSDWPGARPQSSLSPLKALRHLTQQTMTNEPEQAPFAGGWIGFWGYDLAPLLERLPRRLPRQGTIPDMHLAYYDTFAVFDQRNRDLNIVAVDRFREGKRKLQERVRRFLALAAEGPRVEDAGGPLVSNAPTSQFTPDEYCWTVKRILEYIRAGDIFQANLSHRFSAPFASRAEILYSRSQELSPAPFGALLRHADWSIVSTSPERFVQMNPSRRVETRPIKGTRPRGRDTIHDLLLRAELGASEKDRAELTMIVDLERNDLGRVCNYGSIRVAGHAQVESFSNVHHLVSTVTGQLHPDRDRIDLLRAMFPGGSITGAPKIRAMEIIDELERCRRGVYTGAIGYISDDGHLDFNIAIRTLVVDEGTVHYQVGGGIVADSDPLAEYRETLAKGKRMRDILLGEST